MITLPRCGAKLRKKICLKTQTNVRLPQYGAAVMYLHGVPATSASAERLFRIAGRTYDDLRQGMKEQMLEVLMWARIKIVRSASARASRMSSHVGGAGRAWSVHSLPMHCEAIYLNRIAN